MNRAVFLTALAALVAARAAAYTLVVNHQSGNFIHLHWPASALPVLMQINDQTGPSLPNVTPDSDPVAALTRALSHWPAVCGIRFQQGTTSVTSGGYDGVNVMTFADTVQNRQTLEMAGNPIGLTLTFFNPANDELIEADVLFNPALRFTTTVDSDVELKSMQLQDIEGVATHELGHVLGLHHSGVVSATMWPLASVLDRAPDADDIAGARVLYPAGTPSGTIRGTVTVDGAPAFGAQVVALNASGTVAASALTLPDGTYAIGSLARDTYTLYVEPFDGPQAVAPDGGCLLVGNLSGAGIYSGATLTTNFSTTFAGGNDRPAMFELSANATLVVDFPLSSGNNSVNPTFIGPATVSDGSTMASAFSHALAITTGTDQWISVAGANLDQVSAEDISVLGSGVSVDASSLIRLSGSCGSMAFQYLVFHATIASDAAPGGRSLLFRTGSQVSALTGGVRLQAPPCTGDCNGNGTVTVDELLTMVNIALDNTEVSMCTAGDANHDGHITVDEILTAVNNALSGCH